VAPAGNDTIGAPPQYFAAEISPVSPLTDIKYRSTFCAAMGFELVSKSTASTTLRHVLPAPCGNEHQLLRLPQRIDLPQRH
jgi:hypothetical protein